MKPDDVFLSETLRDVFSLVPTDDSIASCREVIAQYGDGQSSISGSITWAEFQIDMRFLRAGVSNPKTMETISILAPEDHPVISEVNQLASNHGLQAGMLFPASSGDGFYWCIPYTAPARDRINKGTLRTVLVTKNLFHEVFDLFNLQCQLTPAEKQCVFQLVSGLNPTEAARHDNVSVETKRSHLKRAMSKLRCNSQSEVMRMMISQMIHIMYLCEQDSSQSRLIEQFTADHLCEPLRLSAQRLPTGRLQRVWEMGPVDGKPLLVLHGYLFPFLMLNAQQALERLNVRLVIPVRGGYLDDQDSASTFHEGALIEQTVEDLLSFIHLTWSGPIDVLCHATGAYYGMLIFQRDPTVFSRFVVTSINLMNERSNSATPSNNFLGGIRKLAKHNGMYKILVSQFQKRVFSNDRSTKYVLRKLFNACPSDLDALNGHAGNGEAFGWYQALHAHSVIGIASDFDLIHKDPSEFIDGVSVPMVFLHGPNDCFTTVEEMRTYVARNKHAVLQVLKDGGHLAIASHSQICWEAIEDALAAKNQSVGVV